MGTRAGFFTHLSSFESEREGNAFYRPKLEAKKKSVPLKNEEKQEVYYLSNFNNNKVSGF